MIDIELRNETKLQIKQYYRNETRLLKRNRVCVKNSKNATIMKKFSNRELRNETKFQMYKH